MKKLLASLLFISGIGASQAAIAPPPNPLVPVYGQVVAGNPTAVVVLTESGDTWTPGTPGSPIITISGTGCSIVSQAIFAANGIFSPTLPDRVQITLSVTSGASSCTLTDPVTGSTGTITVRAPLIHYVRSDGGTPSQCTSLADAPYPGSGSGQACAYNDIRYVVTNGVFVNQSPNAVTARTGWSWDISGTAGGDTWMIRNGITYSATNPFPANPGTSGPAQIGQQGSGSGDAGLNLAGDPGFGGLPPPPSGFASQHTRILGYNFSSCTSPSARAQLVGMYGVAPVISLSGTSYVDIACLDISDQSSCGTSNQTNSCSTNFPLSNYAGSGINFNNTVTNITITDVRIHGMAGTGMAGPTNDGVVLNRVDLIGNAGAGWNTDNGTTGVNSLLYENSVIAWNGCAEEFPIVDALPYQDCTDDNVGGYGDGFGTGTENSPSPGWHVDFENMDFHNNTQDGLDGLHIQGTGSTITANRILAYGNMGNQVKMGSQGILTNSQIIGNCFAMQNAIPGTPSGFNSRLTDYCRSSNEATIMTVDDTFTAPSIFSFNTILQGDYGAGGDATGIVCQTSCSSGYGIVYRNNIIYGFNVSGGTPNRYALNPGSMSPMTQPSSAYSNNLAFGVSNSGGCPDVGETNTLCVAPQIATSTWPVYGTSSLLPTSGSANVVGAGVTCCSTTKDYSGVTRPNPPSIGANEFSGVSSPMNLQGNIVGQGKVVF